MRSTQPQFYDRYGEKWLSSGRDELEELAAAYKASTLCALIDGSAPRRVIDFGCGLGSALHLVASALGATEAIGIDISRSMVEEAGRRHPEHTFVCGGIEELKARGADLLVLFDVIEHIEDVRSLLRLARSRAVRVAIKAPLEKTAYTRLLTALRLKGAGSRHFETEGHLHEFAKEDVERLVAESGLRVTRSIVAAPPRRVWFHPYVREELGAAGGIKGRVRRIGHALLERLPFGLAQRVLTLINGSDLFLVCEGGGL